MRKSPEQQILIKGPDYSLEDLRAVHRLKITKYLNTVLWEINGKKCFEYKETEIKKELAGGYFAIRLMVKAMGAYDNIKLFEILR